MPWTPLIASKELSQKNIMEKIWLWGIQHISSFKI